MKNLNLVSKIYILMKVFLVRNLFLTSLITIIEYIPIFISISGSNWKMLKFDLNEMTKYDFLKNINILYYFKMVYVNTNSILTISNSNFFLITFVLLSFFLLCIIFFKFQNHNKYIIDVKFILNKICINTLGLTIHLGSYFIFHILFNVFLSNFSNLKSCSQTECLNNSLVIIFSTLLICICLAFNLLYFVYFKIFLNIEKSHYPYDNTFSIKFNFFLIWQKILLVWYDNLRNFNLSPEYSKFICSLKSFSLLIFVIYIMGSLINKKNIFLINVNLNLFRLSLLLLNFVYIVITFFFDFSGDLLIVGLIISILVSFSLTLIMHNQNKTAIFRDKKVLLHLIYFLNYVKYEKNTYTNFEQNYYYYLNYHSDNCSKQDCYICHNKTRSSGDKNMEIYYLLRNLIKQIRRDYKSREYSSIYTKTDLMLFKFSKILLKDVFGHHPYSSIFKLKRLMLKNNKKSIKNNIYYYLSNMIVYDADLFKQYCTLKTYEDIIESMNKSLNILGELYSKLRAGIIFDVDLFNIASFLKNNKLKSIKYLNELNSNYTAAGINENLITTLNVIFRFTYNEFANNYLNFYYKDFLDIEQKLQDYYLKDKNIIINYDITNENLKLVQSSGLNFNVKNDNNFDLLFFPCIREPCMELFCNKLSEMEGDSLIKMDLVIRNDDNYINMINLRIKSIPSLNFDNMYLMGTFNFINKQEYIMVRSYKNIIDGNTNEYIHYLSSNMSDLIHISNDTLNLLKNRNNNLTLEDIFTISQILIDDGETYILDYNNLLNTYRHKFLNVESEITDINFDEIGVKAQNCISHKLKLMEKVRFRSGLNNEEYIVFCFQIHLYDRKLSKLSKEELNYKPNYNNTVEQSLLLQESSQTSMTASVNNKDFHYSYQDLDFYRNKHKKDSTTSSQFLNKTYSAKIKQISYLVFCFNILVIIVIIIFVYSTVVQNNALIDLTLFKGKISQFQYNFYTANLFSYIYYYIKQEGMKDEQIISMQNEAYQKSLGKIDLDDVYDYIKVYFKQLIDNLKNDSQLISNKMYEFSASSDSLIPYYILTSKNEIKHTELKFFDYFKVLMNNYNTLYLHDSPIILEIFNFDFNTTKLQFNPNFSNNLSSIQAIAYETIINYYNIYINFETIEFFVYDKYDIQKAQLENLLSIFITIIVVAKVILVMFALLTLKIYSQSITNVNGCLYENFEKEKNDKMVTKLKNLKVLINHSKNPGLILKEILNINKHNKDDTPKERASSTQIVKVIQQPSDFILKFDKTNLIFPYLRNLVIGFSLFVCFVVIFVFIKYIYTIDLNNLAIYYTLNSDLAHDTINNICFTKSIIITNNTDSDLNLIIDKEASSDVGFLRGNTAFVSNSIENMLKMMDQPQFQSTRDDIKNVINCDFIYNNINETFYHSATKTDSRFINLPNNICKSLQYERNTKNLFFTITEIMNYANIDLLNRIDESNRSYKQQSQIFNSEIFLRLFTKELFIIRPIQFYLKEIILFIQVLTVANGFYILILVFLIINIFLELILFYLVNNKFNKKIIEGNNKFSEFLTCVNCF